MGYSLAFKIPAMHDDELSATDELNKFLESPQSIGLDKLKESLRNFVQLMMELKYGDTTGYALQHLVHDDHNSMSIEGTLPADRKKKRKKDQDAINALIDKILREWNESMHVILERISIQIEAIQDVIDKELTKLDFQLESLAKEQVPEEIREQKIAKRNRLKKIRKTVREHAEILDTVKTHTEALEIEEKIQEAARKLKTKTASLPVPQVVENMAAVGAAAVAVHGKPLEPETSHEIDAEDEEESETISSGSAEESEIPPPPTFES